MARPIEYDLEKALDNAMEIFWKRGYENASMAELASSTGLNRGAIYSLFKDKEGLFKDALDNYYPRKAARQIKVLKENSGKKGIVLFFEDFKFRKNYKGCLFSNTMSEKFFLDAQSYSIPTEFFSKVKVQMEENLNQAKEMGEFTGDSKAMALTIITLIHGFHVYGKYNSSKEDSNSIINNILSMIK